MVRAGQQAATPGTSCVAILVSFCMHELKKMDKVAYIRFASVYRSFSDVEDFHDVMRDLD